MNIKLAQINRYRQVLKLIKEHNKKLESILPKSRLEKEKIDETVVEKILFDLINKNNKKNY